LTSPARQRPQLSKVDRLSPLTGEPQSAPPVLDSRVSVQIAPDHSTKVEGPLALCRDSSEEGDVSERALRDDLDRFSTARQKVVVSHVWATGCRKCFSY
jgi:hypothetical protein